MTSFITHNRYYVTAEEGGGRELLARSLATDEGPGPWEQFVVTPIDETHVSLQVHNGRYVAAELDGTVVANRESVGPWETWTVETQPDGTVSLVSHHGCYLTAEGGGPGLLTATRAYTSPGPWESFTIEGDWIVGPTTNHNTLVGALVRDGRSFSDDTGPRVIVCCHFMEAFSAWCHGRQADVEAQCRIIAEHYAGIRVLDVLGYHDCNREGDDYWVAWKGREVTPIEFVSYSGRTIPPTPDYWEQKRAFVTMLHTIGLRIMDDRGDMNSWTNDQKRAHMVENGQFYASLGFGEEVLIGVWAINEAWQNGGDDCELLCDMIHSFHEGAGWWPAVRGLSAPGGYSDPDALAACSPPMSSWEPEMPDSFLYWSEDPATVLTVHGNRGDHTHIIEHYFNYGYDDKMRDSAKVPFNTEPVGGGEGVSVGRVDDPELLCGLTVAALLGGQPWTFMSGHGVFWNGPIEAMPGFKEVARLSQWIPKDIASWPTVVHSGTTWSGTRIMAAVDPTRFDQAISPDGRFVAVCHTVEGKGQALPCERACSAFTVINMLTGLVEREGPLAVGETFQHGGVARLVVGQLAVGRSADETDVPRGTRRRR